MRYGMGTYNVSFSALQHALRKVSVMALPLFFVCVVFF